MNVEFIQQLINQLKEIHFPDLRGIVVKAEPFKGKAFFLRNFFNWKSLSNDRRIREYKIQVNQTLLADPPSQKALEAILVHELVHISGYEKMTPAQFRKLAFQYTFSETFRIQYEKEADEKALEKGFAEGLIQYRLWQYDRLSPQDLAIKKKCYLTPREITHWLHGQRKPDQTAHV